MKSQMLNKLNAMPVEQKTAHFGRCCGGAKWVELMSRAKSFENWDDLLKVADESFDKMEDVDWLEAFQHHPKIGDIDSLSKKFASTVSFAENEQSSVAHAALETIVSLKEKNEQYLAKFGFIFIVCATGKTATEMLGILTERLANNTEKELRVAAEEQRKITKIRLEKIEV
jgi:2-oxo-4-hydroxy-4-carboxy-5-ureidoimidazoline decarboxylase